MVEWFVCYVVIYYTSLLDIAIYNHMNHYKSSCTYCPSCVFFLSVQVKQLFKVHCVDYTPVELDLLGKV